MTLTKPEAERQRTTAALAGTGTGAEPPAAGKPAPAHDRKIRDARHGPPAVDHGADEDVGPTAAWSEARH